MLVLTRKEGQNLYIDKKIRIRVVEICSNKVRLGISAPPEAEVLRQELCESIWGSIPIIDPLGERK